MPLRARMHMHTHTWPHVRIRGAHNMRQCAHDTHVRCTQGGELAARRAGVPRGVRPGQAPGVGAAAWPAHTSGAAASLPAAAGQQGKQGDRGGRRAGEGAGGVALE